MSCVQIRVCNFTERKVILPYHTSIDTAISGLQWMLHYTATSVFVIKAISYAVRQLPFCFWCLIIFVVSAWVGTLFPSAQPLCHKHQTSTKSVMFCEMFLGRLLESHIDLVLGEVAAYQRQIWCQILKTAKVNGKCSGLLLLAQDSRMSQVKGISNSMFNSLRFGLWLIKSASTSCSFSDAKLR